MDINCETFVVGSSSKSTLSIVYRLPWWCDIIVSREIVCRSRISNNQLKSFELPFMVQKNEQKSNEIYARRKKRNKNIHKLFFTRSRDAREEERNKTKSTADRLSDEIWASSCRRNEKFTHISNCSWYKSENWETATLSFHFISIAHRHTHTPNS